MNSNDYWTEEKHYIVNVDFGDLSGYVETYAYSAEQAKDDIACLIREFLMDNLDMNIEYFKTDKFTADISE